MNNAVVRDDARIRRHDITASESVGTNKRVDIWNGQVEVERIAADRFDGVAVREVGGQHNLVDDVRLEDALDQQRIQFAQFDDVQRRQKFSKGVVIRREHGQLRI